MMSTLGVFTTLRGVHEYIVGSPMSTSWGYYVYIRECSVHWGDTMSTWCNIVSIIVGCSVPQGDAISTSGNTRVH